MRTVSQLLFILICTLLLLPQPGFGQGAGSLPPRGTIAYVRDQKEIRLIEADGSSDRRLWAHPRPDLAENQGIAGGLAWRPAGTELAFASGHEAVYSLYEADLYGIRPDGTGLRKITNPPSRNEFARLPKGTVRVTVRSDQVSGLFIVYVAGASEPQSATIGPSSPATLTFRNVADLGSNVNQPVVAMNGPHRWFSPGSDIRPGAAVSATVLNLIGGGVRNLAASLPMWRHDGTQIGYAMGCAGMWILPADSAPGGPGAQLPAAKDGACGWGWAPTAERADHVLLAGPIGDNGIYLARVTGTEKRKLLEYDGTLFELRWQPDGAGFYFVTGGASPGSRLMRYDFVTSRVSTVRSFADKTIRGLSFSPDGAWLAVEFGKSLEESVLSLVVTQKTVPEIWIMRPDGRDLRLLVKNAQAPAWRTPTK